MTRRDAGSKGAEKEERKMPVRHTPGPWRKGTVGNDRVYGPDGMGEHSGLIASIRKNHDANKALIAAAPDLHHALDEVAEILSGCTFETIRIRGKYVDRKESVNRARAALAKARGESQ